VHTTTPAQRELLLEQAAMILRSSEESVPEQADRADVRRRYDAVRSCESRSLFSSQRAGIPWPGA